MRIRAPRQPPQIGRDAVLGLARALARQLAREQYARETAAASPPADDEKNDAPPAA